MAPIERRIIKQLARDILASGRSITVSLERGYDAEDGALVASRDLDAIVAEAMSGDEAHLFVHDAGVPPVADGQLDCVGWVFVTLGNDEDVICDYSTRLEDLGLLAGAEALADAYQAAHS